MRLATFASDDRPGVSEIRSPGYTLLDAGAGWWLTPNIEIRANGRNLLNRTYFASPDPRFVFAPGRSGSLTAIDFVLVSTKMTSGVFFSEMSPKKTPDVIFHSSMIGAFGWSSSVSRSGCGIEHPGAGVPPQPGIVIFRWPDDISPFVVGHGLLQPLRGAAAAHATMRQQRAAATFGNQAGVVVALVVRRQTRRQFHRPGRCFVLCGKLSVMARINMTVAAWLPGSARSTSSQML